VSRRGHLSPAVVCVALLVVSGCAYESPERFIVSVTPMDGASDVEPRTTIAVRLRSVEQLGFEMDGIQVFDGTTPVPGSTVVRDGSGGASAYPSLVFTPEQPLGNDRTYKAVVSRSVLDEEWQASERDFEWSFTVRRSKWLLAPALVAAGAYDVSLAPWGGTNAAALWRGPDDLEGSISTDGAWRAPQAMSSEPVLEAGSRVLVGAAGMAVATWIAPTEMGPALRGRIASGPDWSTSMPIGSAPVDLDNLAYAVSPASDHVAAWSTTTDAGTSIWVQTYSLRRVELPLTIASDLPATVPIVGAWIGGGYAGVVWVAPDAGRQALWAAHRADGQWRRATVIAYTDRLVVNRVRVAASASGATVVLTWWEFADEPRLRIQRWTPASGWGTPALLGSVRAGQLAATPRAVVDDRGTATVAWIDAAGSWLARWTDAGLESPRPTPHRFVAASVAAEPSGRVLLVGADEDGHIVATPISADGELGDSETVTQMRGLHTDLEVGFSSRGNGIVLWTEDNFPPRAITIRAAVYQ
jgi:hypothetical protein